MNARTWIMMFLILGLNWGGFAYFLWRSARQSK
ncbi:MAG: MetS family NSS transporter small subunit [Acidobacteria bacterium]|jgi:hypothetical protein|nr:MetS family NSS transporter small subunit [Acidobacteriota bacterium]